MDEKLSLTAVGEKHRFFVGGRERKEKTGEKCSPPQEWPPAQYEKDGCLFRGQSREEEDNRHPLEGGLLG